MQRKICDCNTLFEKTTVVCCQFGVTELVKLAREVAYHGDKVSEPLMSQLVTHDQSNRLFSRSRRLCRVYQQRRLAIRHKTPVLHRSYDNTIENISFQGTVRPKHGWANIGHKFKSHSRTKATMFS